MKAKYLLGVILMSGFIFGSCNKGWDEEEQKAIDHKIIEQYAKEYQLDGQFTSSGLYYVIYNEGTEAKPDLFSNVTVKYQGYYTDGESLDEGMIKDYPLNRLIKGWQEGIQMIGRNGKMKLVIPSHLAYGHQPQGDVRPDAVLVFDVELIDFSN
jgi:FKBP-type peptidyl-prolyl cis-trans isomerase